jgi:cytochrome c oxidase cbb3-type subunit 1
LMWREYDDQGFLVYSFSESVAAMYPYYVIRMTGGLFFLIGALIMVYNLIRTVREGRFSESVVGAPALAT